MSGRAGGGNIHFRHYFHPAGHGTFFTGHIRHDGRDSDDFVWVYDCGSKRWTHLERLVDQFVTHLAPRNFIDMVCLSHFDSDHVNGVEVLLSKVAVGTLVLPYLSVEARFALAAGLSESAPSAHRTAAFILDPTRYLVERGIGERAERVVLVQGAQDAGFEGFLGADEVPEPRPFDSQDEGRRYDVQIRTRALRPDEVGHHDVGKTEVAEHDRSWLLGGVYELTFYNSALARDQAPLSGATRQQVATELADVITGFGLCASAAPAQGWVKALRQLYVRHFGSRSKQRNEISLCALGRPRVVKKIGSCRKFERDFSHREYRLSPHSDSSMAILMTGDISLDSLELNQICQHFGPSRWNAVGVMQVPHHGSLLSWELGLSKDCVHDHSVICAAPSQHHPHPAVINDLAGRNPVCASYSSAVSFDYHVAI